MYTSLWFNASIFQQPIFTFHFFNVQKVGIKNSQVLKIQTNKIPSCSNAKDAQTGVTKFRLNVQEPTVPINTTLHWSRDTDAGSLVAHEIQ